VRVNGRRRFGVDEGLCIGCGLCHERAPENFEVPPGELCSRVVKQPCDAPEEGACLEAQEYCPAGGVYQEDTDAATSRGEYHAGPRSQNEPE
jgi:ferredoxin